MSDYPAVDFEALAKKYITEKNEAEYRADQIENIATTLKAQLDATQQQLSDAHQKINELTANVEGPASEAVVSGETVKD